MASILSTSSAPMVTLPYNSGDRTIAIPRIGSLSTMGNSMFGGLRLVNKIEQKNSTFSLSGLPRDYTDCPKHYRKATFLSLPKPNLLIWVEIMIKKFGVSIGEGGAENISTVQDAATLIEKVKATSA